MLSLKSRTIRTHYYIVEKDDPSPCLVVRETHHTENFSFRTNCLPLNPISMQFTNFGCFFFAYLVLLLGSRYKNTPRGGRMFLLRVNRFYDQELHPARISGAGNLKCLAKPRHTLPMNIWKNFVHRILVPLDDGIPSFQMKLLTKI